MAVNAKTTPVGDILVASGRTLAQLNTLVDTNTSDIAALEAAAPVPATETAAGIVELATSAETQTGTDATRAVTPAGAKAAYQPLDATLTALAGVATAANALPYFSGTDTVTTTTLSPFGRTLVDDADNTAARTTLGLGTIATQAANNVTITGGAITLTTALPIGSGGTGATSAANAFTTLKQAATESETGVVELATPAEVQTGTDTSRAVTPAGLAGWVGTPATETTTDRTSSAGDHALWLGWTNTAPKTYTVDASTARVGACLVGFNRAASGVLSIEAAGGTTLHGDALFHPGKGYLIQITSSSSADIIGGAAA